MTEPCWLRWNCWNCTLNHSIPPCFLGDCTSQLSVRTSSLQQQLAGHPKCPHLAFYTFWWYGLGHFQFGCWSLFRCWGTLLTNPSPSCLCTSASQPFCDLMNAFLFCSATWRPSHWCNARLLSDSHLCCHLQVFESLSAFLVPLRQCTFVSANFWYLKARYRFFHDCLIMKWWKFQNLAELSWCLSNFGRWCPW